MSIERKKDEKGNLIFGVGSIDFSNQGEAEIKINELEEEKAKKKEVEIINRALYNALFVEF